MTDLQAAILGALLGAALAVGTIWLEERRRR